jgi:MFS family permease
MAGAVAAGGQAVGIAIGYILMRTFLASGMTDVESYHWTYRANIILWIAAICMTFWLSRKLRGEPGMDELELAQQVSAESGRE